VNSRLEVKKEVSVKPIAFASYEDAKHGIRIKVPQDWKTQENNALVISGPQGINVRVDAKHTPYDLEDYTKRNMADLRRIHEVYHDVVLNDIGQANPTVLAGNPAYDVVYTMRVKELPAKGWQVWTVKNKKVYFLTLTTGEQAFDTYLPIVKEMVASLEIE